MEHGGAPIDTLGLESRSMLSDGHHYQFDLNRLGDNEAPVPSMLPYDVIVCAEVLERLYTSPLTVLRFLERSLAPNGILLLPPQTRPVLTLSRWIAGTTPTHGSPGFPMAVSAACTANAAADAQAVDPGMAWFDNFRAARQ